MKTQEYIIIKAWRAGVQKKELLHLETALKRHGVKVYYDGYATISFPVEAYNETCKATEDAELVKWSELVNNGGDKVEVVTDEEAIPKYDCIVVSAHDNREAIHQYEYIDLKYIRETYGPEGNEIGKDYIAYVIDPETGEVVAEVSR